MREKKSLKRAIAFLLATVLAFTTFSSDITAIAAPAGNASNLSVETPTKDGIKLTINWYKEHMDWMAECTSGEYVKYYDQMYGNR